MPIRRRSSDRSGRWRSPVHSSLQRVVASLHPQVAAFGATVTAQPQDGVGAILVGVQVWQAGAGLLHGTHSLVRGEGAGLQHVWGAGAGQVLQWAKVRRTDGRGQLSQATGAPSEQPLHEGAAVRHGTQAGFAVWQVVQIDF